MMVIIFILALILGSFLNVVIYRLPRGESILYPPSHCPKCKMKLKWYELIPLLSYFLNWGRCRYCQERITLQYPLIEIFNGVLWVILYIKYGFTYKFFCFCLLTSLLLAMSVIDLKHTIIPDELNIFAFVLGLAYITYLDNITIGRSAFGLLIGGGLFFLIALVTGGAMGGGDIKLIAVLGLWFGWPQILLIILLSFIIGAIVSVFLLLSKIKGFKDIIPFGPFMAIAAYLNLILGENIYIFY